MRNKYGGKTGKFLRVLIVEDNIYQQRSITRIFEEKAISMGGIEIIQATSVSEARTYVEIAAQDSNLIDLTTVDLSLPEEPRKSVSHEQQEDIIKPIEPFIGSAEDRGSEPEHGLGLLEFVKESRAVGYVAVLSGYDNYESHVRGYGHIFISKRRPQEEQEKLLLDTLYSVWENKRNKLDEKKRACSVLLEKRSRELAHYADKGISYRLSSCFSHLIQSVRHETNVMREEFSERFGLGLESGSLDSLAKSLSALEEAVRIAKEEWKRLQSPFRMPDDSPHDLVIEDVLKKLAEELRPCLTVQLKTPPENETRILSFHDTFRENALMVIGEVLIGGLSEMGENDFSKSWEVAVKAATVDGMAEISFRDNFKPIPAEQAEMITKGENIPPRDGHWRAWGLSVVQHIALRGGGRLIIKPQEDGNLIIYRVTLAQDV